MVEVEVNYDALQQQGQDAAWAAIQADERAEQQRTARATQRRERIAAAFTALGFGETVDGTWRPGRSAQTAGLPAGLVDQARAAVAAEQQARDTLEAKRRQADADIKRLGLSGGAVEYHLQITVGEARTVLFEAHTHTEQILHRLGEAIEQITEARATKAALDGRTATAERAYHQARAAIERDGLAADLVLQRWGVS